MSVPLYTRRPCCFALRSGRMSAAGGSNKGVDGASPNPNVTKLLRRINLTEEEEAIAYFTKDEEVEEPFSVEWAIVGEVLSLTPVHMNTVRSAMKPAWGNPVSLQF